MKENNNSNNNEKILDLVGDPTVSQTKMQSKTLIDIYDPLCELVGKFSYFEFQNKQLNEFDKLDKIDLDEQINEETK